MGELRGLERDRGGTATEKERSSHYRQAEQPRLCPRPHTSQASVVVMETHPGPTLADVGEDGALARILPLLPKAPLSNLGPGDDSAILLVPDGRVVISCDTMSEGPDFRWDWSDPEHVGIKAVASNAADIAAMGAVPTAFEIAVTAPADTPVLTLEGLARGIRDGIAQLAPNAGVLGGDLSVSATFTIAITVLGDLQGRTPVLRSGARPGDILAVSGELGLSRQGLRELLDARGDHDRIVTLKKTSAAVSHHLAPRPPIASGVVAADAGATAMMDISDGLVLDASRLARASGVSVELDHLSDDALFGGEDHGLLATFPNGASLPEGFRPIGKVIELQPDKPVIGRGFDIGDKRGGWDPFQDFSAT